MKNTHSSRLLLASTLAATMALGGVALAQPGPGACQGGGDCMGQGPGRGHGGRHGGPGGMGPAGKLLRLMETLDLTEQQEVALVRLRRELREEGKANFEARKADRVAMAAELAKATPNAAVFHQHLDQRLERQRVQGHAMIDKVLKFHATLSPEQKQALAERLTQVQDRMQKRFERRGAKGR
jgi:Spy/CpxP family protein refolding chaperone